MYDMAHNESSERKEDNHEGQIMKYHSYVGVRWHIGLGLTRAI